MSAFAKEVWLSEIRRYRELGMRIDGISHERGKMLERIGQAAAEAGYHDPTAENPVCFYDLESNTLVSIERDSANAMWNITFADIPVVTQSPSIPDTV